MTSTSQRVCPGSAPTQSTATDSTSRLLFHLSGEHSHPHPFAQRVLALATAWVAEEWDIRQRIRLQALAEGWTPALRAAYDEAELTVDTLARRIDNISLSTLRRGLRDVNLPSPGEVIRLVRLAHARDLIRGSRLLIRDIAHRAGYKSEKHFATKFQDAFGCSPSDYRRRMQCAKPVGDASDRF